MVSSMRSVRKVLASNCRPGVASSSRRQVIQHGLLASAAEWREVNLVFAVMAAVGIGAPLRPPGPLRHRQHAAYGQEAAGQLTAHAQRFGQRRAGQRGGMDDEVALAQLRQQIAAQVRRHRHSQHAGADPDGQGAAGCGPRLLPAPSRPAPPPAAPAPAGAHSPAAGSPPPGAGCAPAGHRTGRPDRNWPAGTACPPKTGGPPPAFPGPGSRPPGPWHCRQRTGPRSGSAPASPRWIPGAGAATAPGSCRPDPAPPQRRWRPLGPNGSPRAIPAAAGCRRSCHKRGQRVPQNCYA